MSQQVHFNVKIIVTKRDCSRRTFNFDALSEQRLERYICNGIWGGGDVRSVIVVDRDGEYCRVYP